jgi:hypothetical protein
MAEVVQGWLIVLAVLLVGGWLCTVLPWALILAGVLILLIWFWNV